MRVHVTLAPGITRDARARRAALRRLRRAGATRFDRPRRLERYGIASGEAPPGCLAALRAVAGVEAVEVDEAEHV